MEWTEDSFVTGEGGGDKVSLTFDFERLKKIGLVMFIFMCLIVGRVYYLQIIKGEHYSAMAKGNRIRIKSIEPGRGIIYDSDGEPLVRNVANFVLSFVPGDMPADKKERQKIISDVADILKQEGLEEEINEKLSKIDFYSLEAYNPVFISDNIEYEKAMLLFLESREMPGVVLSNKTRRKYLNDIELTLSKEDKEEEGERIGQDTKRFRTESLSHILGYIGKINPEEFKESKKEYSPIDYIGKSGIEYTWENKLKGEKGKKQVEVDALGKEKRVISKEEARDGADLKLSLDLDLQAQVENIVQKHLKEKDLREASIVVMDPSNGEILSLVSLPAFDNNIFSKGLTNKEYSKISNNKNKSLFNRAVKGEYPSGSTIKPVIGAAALEEGVISENTTILSRGGIRIGKWFFPDWRAGGHGVTDVRKAIAQSVNTFFYYIGGGYEDFTGLGLERILEYDKKFGLSKVTGIDLPSEADGFLPSREWKKEQFDEGWYIGDTYHLSIGQGFLLATPLQVANFTSVFANKGTLYRPHLVKEVFRDNEEEQIIEKISAPVLNKDFVDAYNLEVIRQGMRRTITRGSARSLSSLPVEIAGKTGTAQWSSQKEPHSWFTSFGPYKDPEIVVTVMVEQGGEGTYTVVPIARDIYEYYFDKRGENG